MLQWTVDQVMALAPDASSGSAGQGLATLKKWTGVGRSERALWGLCQGSGKDPYQTRIDLTAPAFKCSCPSRKFPCKHGLGLMLILAKEGAKIAETAEPGWVSEWLSNRTERADKKAEKAKASSDAPADPEAQAKRAAQREVRVQDGLSGCRVWLEDLARRGLASAKSEPAATWERFAARMVDAQASGLAGMIRRLPELLASGAAWEVRTLDHIGRLHLVVRAGERLAALPPDLAGDVRTALGWAQAKEDALGATSVRDRWAVLGQVIEEEERLRVRRTWLIGRSTRRRSLVLDFAAGPTPLPPIAPAGMEFDGELAFYPSRLELRALIKSLESVSAIGSSLGDAADATVEAALARYAEALGSVPWLQRWPLALAHARLARERDAWYIVDSQDAALPIRPSIAAGPIVWRLLSITGGEPATLCAEWDGETAAPMGVLHGGRFLDVSPRWAA